MTYTFPSRDKIFIPSQISLFLEVSSIYKAVSQGVIYSVMRETRVDTMCKKKKITPREKYGLVFKSLGPTDKQDSQPNSFTYFIFYL